MSSENLDNGKKAQKRRELDKRAEALRKNLMKRKAAKKEV